MKRVGVWVVAAGAMASGFLATACGDDAETGAGGSGGSGGATQSSSTTSTTAGPTTSSSASTTSSSTGGGEGGAGGAGGGADCTDEEGPELTDCDVVEQDCVDPCRPRCIAFFDSSGPDGGTLATCAPLGGEATEDEGCTRPNDNPGEDTCALGFYCSQLGRPADATDERTCRPYCHDQGDCDAQPCFITSEEPTTPAHGYCAPACDPFAGGCPEGDACVKFITSEGTNQLACSNQVGDRQAGETCNGGNCTAGLSCEDFGGGQRCHAYCDDDHPCDGAGCLTPPGSAGYRVCSTEALVAPLENALAFDVAVAEDDSIFVHSFFNPGGYFLGPLEIVLGPQDHDVVKLTPDGEVIWRRSLGIDAFSPGATLAALDDGGVVMVGTQFGEALVDGQSLASLGEADVLMVRFDDVGEVLWSRRLGGAGADSVNSFTIAGDSIVLVAGIDVAADFGGGTLDPGGPARVAAAYALADGAHRWSRTFAPGAVGASVTALDAGTVEVIMRVPPSTTVSVDAVTVGPTAASVNSAVRLVLDSASGTALLGSVLADGVVGQAYGGHPADAGSLVMSWSFEGASTIAGAPPLAAAGGRDLFVASVSGGALDWVHHPSDTGGAYTSGLTGIPGGLIAYTGQISDGRVTIGGLALNSTGAGFDARKEWLGVLDGQTGDVLRAVDVSGAYSQQHPAILSTGRMVTTGNIFVIHDLGL